MKKSSVNYQCRDGWRHWSLSSVYQYCCLWIIIIICVIVMNPQRSFNPLTPPSFLSSFSKRLILSFVWMVRSSSARALIYFWLLCFMVELTGNCCWLLRFKISGNYSVCTWIPRRSKAATFVHKLWKLCKIQDQVNGLSREQDHNRTVNGEHMDRRGM